MYGHARITDVCTAKLKYNTSHELYVKTNNVVSCKAKKKQHACASSGLCNHYSELFTMTTSLKFANIAVIS